jgi:hypothetical protein
VDYFCLQGLQSGLSDFLRREQHRSSAPDKGRSNGVIQSSDKYSQSAKGSGAAFRSGVGFQVILLVIPAETAMIFIAGRFREMQTTRDKHLG